MADQAPLNPFLLPHIVENIIRSSRYSDSDYQSFRLVSHEWNQAATRDWKLEEVVLTSAARMEEGISLLTNALSTMPTIRELVLVPELFISYASRFVSDEFQRNLGKFLSLVSSELIDITLIVGHDCRLKFKEDHFVSLSQLPKVREMRLEMHTADVFFVGSFFLDLSRKLLTSTSVLERLTIIYTHNEPKIESRRIGLLRRNAFGKKILRNIPPTIKYLDFLGTFTNYDAILFRALPLPLLTDLDMKIELSSLTGRHIYQLFENKNHNLTRLVLKLNQTETNITEFRLPVFPELVELELKIWSPELTPTAIAQPAFPVLFPKLTYLELGSPFHPLDGVFDSLFPAGFQAPQLSALIWSQVLYLEPPRMQILTMGFSGLRSLVIQFVHVNLAALPNITMIFQECFLLEELSLKIFVDPRCNGRLDSIFTGIPDERIVEIRNSQNWAAFDLMDVKTSPGITDLKNLRFLSFLSSSVVNPKITDITGFFGFMKLPRLEMLQTCQFRMSQRLIRKLVRKFGADQICVVPV